MTAGYVRMGSVDFARVNAAALRNAEAVIAALLPGGRREGAEWVVRNPLRADRKPGSFKVNINTCKWSDFATGDAGGDVVSLAAYVTGLGQREAAIRLAESIGVTPFKGD